jgi:glycosyltransferase involved in cell wall biosynthesis
MINLIAPINQLGYGITGLNIAKSLSKITDFSLWIIGQAQLTDNEEVAIISKMIRNAEMFHQNAPCVRIWHQNDMAQFVGRGIRIGFPIFELDEFNLIEKHHLSTLDKIFVCSDWAKKIVLDQIEISEENVSVIPLGVNTDIFRLAGENQNKNTVFFNCGKWEIRKGHDIIPEVFSRAFNVDDNVELWMMNTNPFLSKEEHNNWQQLYKNTKLGSKIKFIGYKAKSRYIILCHKQTVDYSHQEQKDGILNY